MTRTVLLHLGNAPSIAALVQQCQAALKAGFDGVEWVLPTAACGQRSTGAGLAGLDGLSSGGLQVRAIAGQCTSMNATEAAREVTDLLHQAYRLTGTCLNLTIPPLRREPGDPGFARYQEGLNFAYELLHLIRFEAESTGVVVALEAAAGGGLLSPVELREIIDAANSRAVGACVDVRRISRIGCPADWVTTLRHRVHALRLSDLSAPVTTRGGAKMTFALPDLLGAALDEVHFEGPVIAPLSGDLAKARACIARLNPVDTPGSVHVTGPSG